MKTTYRGGGHQKVAEEGRCRMCLTPWRSGGAHARTRHHIVPKERMRNVYWRLRDCDENIVPLCVACHRAVEIDEMARAMLRKVLGSAEVAYARMIMGGRWFDERYPALGREHRAVGAGLVPEYLAPVSALA